MVTPAGTTRMSRMRSMLPIMDMITMGRSFMGTTTSFGGPLMAFTATLLTTTEGSIVTIIMGDLIIISPDAVLRPMVARPALSRGPGPSVEVEVSLTAVGTAQASDTALEGIRANLSRALVATSEERDKFCEPDRLVWVVCGVSPRCSSDP